MELFDLTLHELSDKLRRREVSSVEATRAMLARIEATDGKVNAFITVTPEQALQDAEAADKRIAAGEADLLTGIPVALKDIFLTRGDPDHLRLTHPGEFHPPLQRHRLGEAEGAGRGPRRAS